MNLLLIHPDDCLDERRARITGRALEHLQRIRRVAVGDRVPAGLIDGPMGEAEILTLSDTEAEVALTLHQAPPEPLPLTLVLALPRPKMMRRVLQSVVSLGVKELVLLNSYKVEKSFWQTPWLAPDALDEQIRLGLEQAMDTTWPRIQQRRLFRPFVEDELGDLAGASERLIAHPGVSNPCPRGLSEPVTLCIGPEGGFIPFEVELIQAQGFTPVHLGPRILRVETAVPALLARLF